MKKFALLALIGIILVVVCNLISSLGWEYGRSILEAARDADSNVITSEAWEQYESLAIKLGFFQVLQIIGKGLILSFFIKLYTLQDKMKKTTLLGIVGLSIVILVSLLHLLPIPALFVNSAARISLSIISIIGYALLIPFFATLYKKQK